MAEQLDPVIASYHRCRQDEAFIDTFYEVFLKKSPEIAQLFARTDFRIQKLMLRESLLEMLSLKRGTSGGREEIERLGRRHQELNVTAPMYTQWLDSLCEAIQRHDPEYTPQLEQLWREAMRTGIDIMMSPPPAPKKRRFRR